MARRSAPPANWREFASLDSVSAGLDASPIFAYWDDGDPRKEATVVRHPQNPLCMLLGLLLADKSLGGTRDEFGSYEIDPVISHVILLTGVMGGTVALMNQYLIARYLVMASIAERWVRTDAYGKQYILPDKRKAAAE